MTVAPLIGGSLTHPYERFPKTFGKWPFWQSYPYFLPCLVAAIFPVSAFLLAAFFMKEVGARDTYPRHRNNKSMSRL